MFHERREQQLHNQAVRQAMHGNIIGAMVTEVSQSDVMISWAHLPHHLTFVKEIHRSPVVSPHKRPVV